jgi:hypothetical protein
MEVSFITNVKCYNPEGMFDDKVYCPIVRTAEKRSNVETRPKAQLMVTHPGP